MQMKYIKNESNRKKLHNIDEFYIAEELIFLASHSKSAAWISVLFPGCPLAKRRRSHLTFYPMRAQYVRPRIDLQKHYILGS